MRKLILIALFFISQQSFSEILCVVPSGSDCGTSGATKIFTGLANVQYATSDTVDKVDADDTLYICGAFTGETLSLTGAGGEGTSGHPITVSFACPGNPGSVNLNSAVDYAIILGAGTDYITIVGIPNSFVITGATTAVSGNQGSISSLDGTGIVITDLATSGNTTGSGWRIRKCQSCTITRPVVTGSLNHGIFISGDAGRNATDITIDSPVIYSNGWQAISIQGSSATTDVQRIVVKNPIIYGNGDGPYPKFTKNVTIYGTTPGACHIYSNTNTANALAEGYGIGVQQSDFVTIYNCDIHGNRSDGIEVWGNSTVGSINALIYSNYIYDQTNPIADDTAGNGIECRTGYSDCHIFGNILVNNQRNLRVGPSSLRASEAVNNTLVGGVYSVRGVVGTAPGYNTAALTGWTFYNNIMKSASTEFFHTDVASGNSNIFAKNLVSGSATYENTNYTSTTFSAIDSTRLDNTNPEWLGGLSPTTSAGYKLKTASALRRAGQDLNIGNIQDKGNRAFLHPPSIGAWEAASGDLAAERTLR